LLLISHIGVFSLIIAEFSYAKTISMSLSWRQISLWQRGATKSH